jgi:hypothetical protein
VDRVILVQSYPTDSHFCRYVQMDHTGSTSADVESWTLVNYLEEGRFPALLWDTLKDFGYTTYPEYSTREVMTTGQLLHCEVKVKISVCLTNPAWEEWECKAQGRNFSDTVQKAEGCSRSTHNFLWEAPCRDSRLCSQSNPCT